MALKIAILSQKGGVGKTTLVRALATEYARNDWNVKVADMDLRQKTSTEWNCTRMESEITPALAVEPFAKVSHVLKQDDQYDLIIFDGTGQANVQTLEIAKICDLVLLPSGVTRDDLVPQIKLAHEMRKNGIDKLRIGICLSRVGASEAERIAAQDFIEEGGYRYLGFIPEKTSIGQAHDAGYAANETKYKSITGIVDQLVQSVGDMLSKIEEKYG